MNFEGNMAYLACQLCLFAAQPFRWWTNGLTLLIWRTWGNTSQTPRLPHCSWMQGKNNNPYENPNIICDLASVGVEICIANQGVKCIATPESCGVVFGDGAKGVSFIGPLLCLLGGSRLLIVWLWNNPSARQDRARWEIQAEMREKSRVREMPATTARGARGEVTSHEPQSKM